MEIPFDRLSPEALRALIVEFVTRDGTDYGEVEALEADKVRQVEEQLRARKIVVVYDAETETCNLVQAPSISRST
jgi:uncharacterized protein YheU (UPF0270 family)